MQLAGSARYLVVTEEISIDEAYQREFTHEFNPAYYANKDAIFWIRLDFYNETDVNQFIITLDQWNLADVYIRENDDWRVFNTGTLIPVDLRPISFHRLLSFPLIIQPKEYKTVLIKAKLTQPLIRYYANLYSFHSKIEISEASHTYDKYITNQLLVLFILGVMSILIIYNISLFILNKQYPSLVLCVYLLSISVFVANIHGIATNYFFRGWQGFEMALALNLHHFISIVVAVFLLLFFKIKKYEWEIYLLALFVLFISFSWFYSVYSSQSFLYFERRYFEYFTFISVILSSIIKKKEGSKILLVAILSTIITSYFAEFKAVFFANTTFTGPDLPYLFGILIQMLIFSIAISYQVQSLQINFERATKEKQKLIEDQNEQLKWQVAEKTKQLQDALFKLQQQNEQLEAANEELISNTEELQSQTNSIKELNNKLEEIVVKRTEALHATMRDLDTFLYRASHDLRRPLMTILGLGNLIKRERDFNNIAESVDLVSKTVISLDRMLKKLNAIGLCFQERIDKEKVELRDIIYQAIDLVRTDYPENNFNIIYDGKDSFTSHTNPYLLKTIIGCVLENAIMYGEGGVNIEISLIKKSRNQCVISFKDDGPGVKEELLPLIFDMFLRAHEKSTGNGLGLYLVKMGMQKLGGEVSARSSHGNGFRLDLVLNQF